MNRHAFTSSIVLHQIVGFRNQTVGLFQQLATRSRESQNASASFLTGSLCSISGLLGFDDKKQIAILTSIRTRLRSAIANVGNLLQSDLFESELEAADALKKAGHFRAAGVLAGVTLEAHLSGRVVDLGVPWPTRKKRTLSNLTLAMYGDGRIDLTQKKHLDWLADIRNKCAHKKKEEPTQEEVEDILKGVKKVIATI